jgi:hypothetical protein
VPLASSQSRLLRLKDLLLARARFVAENFDLSFSPAGDWELERRVSLLLRACGELLLADRRRLSDCEAALEDLVERMAAVAREDRLRVIGPDAIERARAGDPLPYWGPPSRPAATRHRAS